jgi:uncharacterized protein (DUF3820 family)
MAEHVIPWGQFKGTPIKECLSSFLIWFRERSEAVWKGPDSPGYDERVILIDAINAELERRKLEPRILYGKYRLEPVRVVPVEYLEWFMGPLHEFGKKRYTQDHARIVAAIKERIKNASQEKSSGHSGSSA